MACVRAACVPVRRPWRPLRCARRSFSGSVAARVRPAEPSTAVRSSGAATAARRGFNRCRHGLVQEQAARDFRYRLATARHRAVLRQQARPLALLPLQEQARQQSPLPPHHGRRFHRRWRWCFQRFFSKAVLGRWRRFRFGWHSLRCSNDGFHWRFRHDHFGWRRWLVPRLQERFSNRLGHWRHFHDSAPAPLHATAPLRPPRHRPRYSVALPSTKAAVVTMASAGASVIGRGHGKADGRRFLAIVLAVCRFDQLARFAVAAVAVAATTTTAAARFFAFAFDIAFFAFRAGIHRCLVQAGRAGASVSGPLTGRSPMRSR